MLRTRVGRNALAGSSASVLAIILGLITTPVLLHSLGVTNYGALAVVGSLTAYIGVLDFGIGGSLGRYMTMYEEQGDHKAVSGVMTFAFAFYGLMTIVLAPSVHLVAPSIGSFLSFPTYLQRELPSLLVILFGIFVLSNLTGILSSRLLSVHRLDLVAYVGMISSVCYTSLIFVVVPRYPSIYTVFLCNITQIVILMLGMYIALRRIVGPRPLRLSSVSLSDMRDLLSFGLWTQVSSITAIVNLEADKVIISKYLGVADVSPYQVANRVALLNRVFPLQLISAMLPEVVARVSRGLSRCELEELYSRSSRALMLWTLIISGFIASAADGVLRFWLGARLPWAPELCAALVLSYVVNNATGIGTTIIKAQGHPQLETRYGLLSAVLNIGITLALVPHFHLFGVVAGTILGNVCGSLYFLYAFHRQTGLSWWRGMGSWLSRLVVMTIVAGASVKAFSQTFDPTIVSRGTLFLELALEGILYLLIFALLGYLLRFWSHQEYSQAKGLWRALWFVGSAER